MEVWIVSKMVDCDNCNQRTWNNGVFDSEEKAVKACITEDYFITPLILNEHQGDEEERPPHPGSYYPLVETQEEGTKRLKALEKVLDV